MQTHLERFIRFLAAEKGLSTAYQLSVRQTLEEFARFLEMENTGLAQTGIDTLSAFLRHLQDRGMARSSMRVEMVHLRIFFPVAGRNGNTGKRPFRISGNAPAGLSLPHVLDQKTVSSLLESIDIQDIPLGCRDRALLEMIYACGMRVSEIINCKLESFDRDEAFVRVLGKGDKTRLVPVGRSALNALQMYLEKGRPKLVRTVTKSHIFLTMRGRPLTRERVRQILRERARAAGLEQHVFPAYPAPFLRHASSGKRSGSAHYSGDAGSCRYFNHPDLYAFGAAAAELDSSPLSSQRIGTLIHHSFPCRVFFTSSQSYHNHLNINARRIILPELYLALHILCEV